MNTEHVIVHKEPHLYSSHPCITALHNGEWLVAFNQSAARGPFLHPPADPHYINLVIRSVDRGRTWSDPQMAPGFSWYGMENPGIAQLDNGDVLLNQFKFNWLPRDLAYVHWKEGAGGLFVCPDAGAGRHKWFPARSQADWDGHAFPYAARTDGGAFVQISLDNGHTWTHTVPLDIAPYQGAFSPKGALQLASGDVLLALGSHDHDPLHASFVLRSTDYGRTWKAPAEVARLDGCEFCEPSITQTTTGRVICMLREERSGFIYQSHSDNDGESWSPVRRLDLWGYPPHIITLTDDRLLDIYGHRRPPYGIYAALSDDGASWSTPFLVRDLPNPNLGYPSVIEYEPGRLFTVYYGEDTDQVTCLHGTYFDLDVPDATASGRLSAYFSAPRERVD